MDAEKYEAFNCLPAIICVLDGEGNCLFANKAWEDFTNISVEDAKGKGWQKAVLEEDLEEFPDLEEVLKNNDHHICEFRLRKAGGSYAWMTSTANRSGDVFIKVMADVSDMTMQLKQAEEKERRATEFLKSVLDGIPDPIFVKDREHVWIEGNKAFFEMFGDIEKEKILGKSDYEFFPKEEADIFWEKDNEVFVTEGVVDNFETFTRDNETRTLFTRKVVVTNPNGEKILVGAIRDITELEKIKDRLERAVEGLTESNEELERFAYIASHDLQEPLRVVVNFTGLLKKRYGDRLDDEAHKYIEFASEAAHRMEALIADLLEYARLDEEGSRNSEVRCTEILDYVKNGLVDLMEARGAIVESKSNLPVLSNCNPVRLVQLMQNLITNAIKYTADDMKPKVEISCEEVSTEDGEFWQFSFKDNGIGIEKEYYERIFNPFKRLHTSDEYSGTGIGLAICKKIVAAMEGEIWVESEYGKGSTFYFTIPKSPSDGVSA